MDMSLMLAELTRDEGLRLNAYDDASGATIKPGTTVAGHCTVGIGRALDVRGVTPEEARYLCLNDANAFFLGLQQAYTWFNNLDDVRQRVLVNMAFNMGLHGIAGFPAMLGYLAEQRYDMAAREMQDSVWFHQVGARAVRLVDAMSTGVAQ